MVFKLLDGKQKLKVTLSYQDLKKLNTTFDEIYYNNINTKKIIIDILAQAKLITGFDSFGKVLLIEMHPDKENGCIIYFSMINNEKLSEKLTDSIFANYSFEYSNIDDLIYSSVKLFETAGYKIFKSSLYKDKLSNQYFLTLTAIGIENKDIISLLKEFSTLKSQEKIFHSFIDEHYYQIIKDNALEVLYNNFK